MASTSTSSVEKSFKYDVFLSFRGEDTRHNFVSHLYKSLVQNGILTYKDDEKIEKGETIDTQLIESIEDSRFFIIVFSKDYAGSSWCLDELVKIMECQKTSEQTAYPIFYDVEPTEISKQSGAVEKAFKKHENKEAAGKWRKALNEAGNLAGWESKKAANGDESKLIEIIVEDIFQKICSGSLSVDGNLIGMETRIEALLLSLEPDVDDVRMIGIWGMGGGGKTTLATTMFNQISHQFEGCSFVDKVREVSKRSLSGLKKLQKQILTDIFSDQNITVRSVSSGKSKMVQMMRRKKVLIVLDDIDCTEQLEALAADPNWYKSGSRIIITTRDEQVLVAHKVGFINNITLLTQKEAIRLFNRYAFTKETTIQWHKEVSTQVVKYAHGLPLTIKVLGSLLCGQNEPEWKDALERLKTIPLKETMKSLELSYDALDDDYKEIFLDVACLLKGWEKDDAIRALESCGVHARNGLRVLEQRSLITYDKCRRLEMHDHIEEMGMNIVRRVNTKKPEMHSRLWIQQEIKDILLSDSVQKKKWWWKLAGKKMLVEKEKVRMNLREATPAATQCIRRLDAKGLDFEMLMNGLANMKELRFLYLNTNLYYDHYRYRNEVRIPNGLRFLRWDWYPFKRLPKTFQPKNLVGLHMEESSMVELRIKGEEKPFPNLTILKFYTSRKLRSLDLSVAPNLRTLILEHCYNLVEVHFQVTPNLKELYILNCWRLEKLHMPAESPKLTSLRLQNLEKLRTFLLGVTPNLETVTIFNCTYMVELRIPAECPKLTSLHLEALQKLRTFNLGITPNLETLSLGRCTDMVELRIPAECPKLTSLNLEDLQNLRTFNLGITPNLKMLSLSRCTDMVKLRIPAECPKLTSLNLKDLQKLRTFNLGITPNLERLSVSRCTDMIELRIPAECPKLTYLDLEDLQNLRTFNLGITPNLKMLSLSRCTDMVELRIPAECPKLTSLHLEDLQKLRTFNLGITPKTLSLSRCTDMVELHIPAECPKLTSLYLKDLQKLRTINLGITPNLERLTLIRCTDMVELRIPAECPKLTNLFLHNLQNLRTLHLGITPNLEELRLYGCTDMVELHIPAEMSMKGLANKKELRFLHVYRLCAFEEEDSNNWNLPNALRFLSWHHYPFSSLPKTFQPNNLVLLEMSGDNMNQLWKDGEEKPFPNLRFLQFTWSSKLRSLDLSVAPKLETLILEYCKNLEEVHFQDTPNLRELRITNCKRLEKLHMPTQSPKLTSLDLKDIQKLRTFNLGMTPNLEGLSLSGCTDMVELHITAECPKLVSLDLSDCIRLAAFPEEIGRLECLKSLNIAGTGISRLPESILRLKGLCIVWSQRLLESYGFTPEIENSDDETYYIYIEP